MGGGGEKRTLRIVAQHGGIGHWFSAPLEDLKRKKAIFEEHCQAVGRDPSEVMLTIGVNVVLLEHEKDAAAAVERVPEPRRPLVSVALPEQAAANLGKFIASGLG